jgi:hypothetical protein
MNYEMVLRGIAIRLEPMGKAIGSVNQGTLEFGSEVRIWPIFCVYTYLNLIRLSVNETPSQQPSL